MPQPFFRNKKAQDPYLQTFVFLPHQAVLLTCASSVTPRPSQLLANDRLSSLWGTSALTVAVPFRNCTGFTILLQRLSPPMQALNGNIDFPSIIASGTVFVKASFSAISSLLRRHARPLPLCMRKAPLLTVEQRGFCLISFSRAFRCTFAKSGHWR